MTLNTLMSTKKKPTYRVTRPINFRHKGGYVNRLRREQIRRIKHKYNRPPMLYKNYGGLLGYHIGRKGHLRRTKKYV
jgi:hypothetical protein